MTGKEKIIAFLRKQLAQLQAVHRNMDKLENEIKSNIEELEDESRLGVPAKYDFGKQNIKSTEKNILKQVKKDVKILKDIQDTIEKIQSKSSLQISSEMEEFTKE